MNVTYRITWIAKAELREFADMREANDFDLPLSEFCEVVLVQYDSEVITNEIEALDSFVASLDDNAADVVILDIR